RWTQIRRHTPTTILGECTMNDENEAFVLGEDVTSLAASKRASGTAVVSVRLTSAEVAELESLSRASGKTISQIAREALTAYVRNNKQQESQVSITCCDGVTWSFGSLSQWGEGTQVEKSEVKEKVA
ncbi:MAG: ribbon-helix-helix domain-containing protein, partial [Dehalococcoidales bacterium]|nr:ribbon-helix-helix domain-containing protein [Dehalococcoidales bacterium]